VGAWASKCEGVVSEEFIMVRLAKIRENGVKSDK